MIFGEAQSPQDRPPDRDRVRIAADAPQLQLGFNPQGDGCGCGFEGAWVGGEVRALDAKACRHPQDEIPSHFNRVPVPPFNRVRNDADPRPPFPAVRVLQRFIDRFWTGQSSSEEQSRTARRPSLGRVTHQTGSKCPSELESSHSRT